MNNRFMFVATFALGALAVVWMTSQFFQGDWLAFAICVLIAAVFVLGFVELRQFRRATDSLRQALTNTADGAPESLDAWLAPLHPALKDAVRLRVEGERVGLPGPVLAPYLTGLLVMLGLLGTFVGMVATLGGAVQALEASTELEAIRNGLAAPIEGLGLAFGTSVAGVAASAMLGLAAALCRRDRLLVTRELDRCISAQLSEFSLARKNQRALIALQEQSAALPDVSRTLNEVATTLAQLSQSLQEGQAEFYRQGREGFDGLAKGLDQSLRDSLAGAGQQAGESLAPLVEQAMSGVQAAVAQTQQDLTANTLQQLEAFREASLAAENNWRASFDSVVGQWQEDQAQAEAGRHEQWQAALDSARSEGESAQAAMHAALEQSRQQDEARQQATRDALSALVQELKEQQRADHTAATANIERLITASEQLVEARIESERDWTAGHLARLDTLEESAAARLEALGKGLEAPIAGLIETASQAPQAAADVIAQLREEISNNLERDKALLEERREVLEDLHRLSAGMEQTATRQGEAVESLVEHSSQALLAVSERFGEQLEAKVDQIADSAADFAGSAVEMSALGAAFGTAVEQFGATSEALSEQLQTIGQALAESGHRSDEQMAYYVAQAREIIDQSLISQREVIEELRQVGSTPDLLAAEG